MQDEELDLDHAAKYLENFKGQEQVAEPVTEEVVVAATEPVVDTMQVETTETVETTEQPITTETTTEVVAEEKVVLDDFSSLLDEVTKEVEEEKIDPRIKEYDAIMGDSDPILRAYIDAKMSGGEVSFNDFLKMVNPIEYGVNNAEQTFKDYLKTVDPNMSSDEIDAEVYRFAPDGFDSLGVLQKKQIEAFGKELSGKSLLPKWKKPKQFDYEAYAKKDDKVREDFEKKRLDSEIKIGEISYKFTPDQVKAGSMLLKKIQAGVAVDKDTLVAKDLIRDMAVWYANKDKIVTFIVNSAKTKTITNIKKEQANLNGELKISSSNIPQELTNKTTTVENLFRKAQQAQAEA